MGLTAHKAYNSAWYCTSSENPLRPIMREKQERFHGGRGDHIFTLQAFSV